jgi:myosin heavy subunit
MSSGSNKYEVKKQGFGVTKDDRERDEQEKKREKLLAKVAKLDFAKAEAEFDALNRSTYLAPHQHERRHFLQQAISIIKKQQAEKDAKQREDEVESQKRDNSKVDAEATKKRPRDDDTDDDDDNFGATQSRQTGSASSSSSLVVQSSAWSKAIDAFPSGAPMAPPSIVVVQAVGTRASVTGSAVGFVPRAVAQKQRLQAAAQVLQTEASNGPSNWDYIANSTADVDSFLDDL